MEENKGIKIICPLYNAEKYILNLDNSINKQKNVKIENVKYVLTRSNDNSKKILEEINADYKEIKKEEFSHSLVREKEALNSNSYIVVFISQDIIINDEYWLYNLTKPIFDGECDASYSKQICTNNTIEKYTRECNYPEKSFIASKDDIEKKGLKTFFFSDASSAIKTETFKKLKGYDGKKLPINEDMYIAYKLIMNGYKIKYCADSKVIHSHTFTLKQIYDRYKLTGIFLKQNSYLDKYGTNKSGGGLAKYILKRAIQDKNIKALINFVPNMIARFIGLKIGKLRG